MTVEDELTPSQRNRLQQDLQELEAALKSTLSLAEDSSKPVSLDQPIGRLTRMDAIQQQQMARASRSANQLRLRQVQAALRSLEGDEYGACKQCGESIGFKRLSARPEAPFCLSCQEAREKR